MYVRGQAYGRICGILVIVAEIKQAQIAAMTTLLPFSDLTGVEALPASKPPLRRRRVVFLVFTDVEIIDLCGPLDVFQHANNTLQLTGRDNEPGYETLVVALQAGEPPRVCRRPFGLSHAAKALPSI